MNDSTRQVQNASNDMTRNSQRIISDVGTLQRETDTIKQSMQEMGDSAERVTGAGSALSEIAGLMKHSISDIGEHVDSFKV
jgi:methyl-accepting chemotaxis protein